MGIHDRMPVIIQPHSYSQWLDTDAERTDALAGMLLPYDVSVMEAYQVARGVNNPQNDSPKLIEPVH
ncbi:MAG: SOS response-associated peptidase [Gammaproteobacteria bacterium]|nr:SOS response-associated peptidase [Gammaproteobacteria bacterium]